MRELDERYGELVRARYPKIPRRVSGYNLDQLLPENGFNLARAVVGSEGTLAVVLSAMVRLVAIPKRIAMVLMGFDDIFGAADQTPWLLEHRPQALEGFDHRLPDFARERGMPGVRYLPDGRAFLIAELGAETDEDLRAAAEAVRRDAERVAACTGVAILQETSEQRAVWGIRESGLGAGALLPGQARTWPGAEDCAVPPARLGEFLRRLVPLLARYELAAATYYGHFGEGCVHCRINFDFFTAAGIAKFRAAMTDIADLVVEFGGSLSGEHGDGRARSELLPKMYGRELLGAFREFKAAFDPDRMMNPGVLAYPEPLDAHLRIGINYSPQPLRTRFDFSAEGGLAGAALKCVGIGKCRKTDAGMMCPSYMATREEMHSTRGRARLLFEMLQGDPLENAWRNHAVREALDLCLACKGCKGDCPVHVDMATYKAEFLSHYYQGRLRPLSAYTMGLIYWWARLACRIPTLANFLTHAPVLSDIAKAVIGVAPQRRLPVFASQTFKEWFRQRGVRNPGAPKVILWPDTFNNYLHPETLQAGVEVLEAAGYQVVVPEQSLCCGRPLYDFGMLDTAERLLRQILQTLEPEIIAGTPIVGLEPSCVAVFRDELTNLFPHDENARRLKKQVFVISEFLEKVQWRGIAERSPLQRKAVVHMHCHHKAIMRTVPEEAVLKKLGLDYTVLDSGCCGMAGSFGFEKDHYDVSIKCGERVLLPAVRNADKNTLIIADGFSCREQIAQTTDRRALHLAQVIQMALQQDDTAVTKEYPETTYLPQGAPARAHKGSPLQTSPRLGIALVSSLGLLLLSAILWLWGKKRAR